MKHNSRIQEIVLFYYIFWIVNHFVKNLGQETSRNFICILPRIFKNQSEVKFLIFGYVYDEVTGFGVCIFIKNTKV